MTRQIGLAMACALAASRSAAPLAAQTPMDPPYDFSYLSVPEDFSTRLARTQFTYEGSFMDRYRVRVRAGQILRIRVDSDDFDPKLTIGRIGSRYVRDDDDGGGGTAAQLTVRYDEDTTLVVVVYSYGAEQTGAYRIRISEPPLMPSNGTWSGWLRANDVLLGDGTYGEHVWFEARAGERFALRLQSQEFDAYLSILDAGGETLEEDDDSAGGTDAQLEFVAPATGRYLIEMSSARREQEGEYRLTLNRLAQTVVSATTPTNTIAIGQRVAGEITAADSRDCGAEARCDHFTFEATAGDRLSITMVSETDQLDPVVKLIGPGDLDLGSNDDDPENGRNSRLDFTAARTGRYRIIARSYSAGGSGRYVLSVQRLP